MTQEDQVVATLRKRLEENLIAVKYDGPQQLITGDLVTLLMDLLISVLDGCFSSNGSLEVAKVKRLNFFQKVKLKNKLIDEVYEGNRRAYRVEQGSKVLDALVNTVEKSDPTETDALLGYVEHEAREWTPTNYRSL